MNTEFGCFVRPLLFHKDEREKRSSREKSAVDVALAFVDRINHHDVAGLACDSAAVFTCLRIAERMRPEKGPTRLQ